LLRNIGGRIVQIQKWLKFRLSTLRNDPTGIVLHEPIDEYTVVLGNRTNPLGSQLAQRLKRFRLTEAGNHFLNTRERIRRKSVSRVSGFEFHH
jgi:hypothetical protein